METGGTVLSLDLAGGKAAAFRFLDALEIVLISNNLGDTKSLVTHPATTTHQRLTPEQRAALGIGDGLVRLSVGLEDPDDLLADIRAGARAGVTDALTALVARTIAFRRARPVTGGGGATNPATVRRRPFQSGGTVPSWRTPDWRGVRTVVQMFRPAAGFAAGDERPSRGRGRGGGPHAAALGRGRCRPAIGAADISALLAGAGAPYPALNRSYPSGFVGRRRPTAQSLPDLQNGPESLIKGARAGIQHVGISNFRLPVRFRTREGGEVQLETSVTGSVSLEADRKGINMSRIMRSFYKHAETQFSFEVIGAVLDSYLADLDSYDARIMMRFRYPMLKRSLRSGLEGWQYYDVALEMAKTAAGDPAHRPPRLRLLLDLPLLARALRARPPHPQPDRDAALAAVGRAGVGRAGRRRHCSGSRTSSTSATPRSRPRPR